MTDPVLRVYEVQCIGRTISLVKVVARNAQEAKRLARSADAIPLTSETTPTGTGRAWRADE